MFLAHVRENVVLPCIYTQVLEYGMRHPEVLPAQPREPFRVTHTAFVTVPAWCSRWCLNFLPSYDVGSAILESFRSCQYWVVVGSRVQRFNLCSLSSSAPCGSGLQPLGRPRLGFSVAPSCSCAAPVPAGLLAVDVDDPKASSNMSAILRPIIMSRLREECCRGTPRPPPPPARSPKLAKSSPELRESSEE